MRLLIHLAFIGEVKEYTTFLVGVAQEVSRSNRTYLDLAFTGRGDSHALIHIGIEFVAQGADGDAQYLGRMDAVADGVFEGVDDQIPFHIGDGASD